jgi:hypothetical protein
MPVCHLRQCICRPELDMAKPRTNRVLPKRWEGNTSAEVVGRIETV